MKVACVLGRTTLWICFILLGQTALCFADAAQKEVRYPNIKPFGVIQPWAVNERTPGATYGDDYVVARARAGIKGNLTPRTDYMLLTDWGRYTFNDPCTLMDAWVNYNVNPSLNIKAGQTWYKFTLSGSSTITNIPFAVRPEIIDAIWLNMGRNGSYGYDKGIELWSNFKKAKMPWSYVFFISAGSGLNRFEDNNQKDFSARLTIEPVKGLMLGTSGFCGWSRAEIRSNLGSDVEKNLPEYAYGVDASYTQKYFRIITESVQALYEGRQDYNGAEIFNIDTQKQRGWYVMLGLKPLSWIEIPIQYAWYEKNYVRSNTGLETITIGLTWTLKPDTLNNIKINYMMRSAEANYGSKPRNKFIAQLQLVF